MENQGEGRVQEGDALSSAEDRFQCEGLPEDERGHQKRICRAGGDRLEPSSVGRRRGRWRVSEFRRGPKIHGGTSECREKERESESDPGRQKEEACRDQASRC
eukprot:397671-Heterocapsa_arctica.AAC.1